MTTPKLSIDQLSSFKTRFQSPKDWTTAKGETIAHRPFKKYLRSDIPKIFMAQGVTDPFLEDREIVAQVFPFKINQFTIDQIDWKHYLTDPIFKLTFPQPEMLSRDEINQIKELKESNASRETIATLISDIRSSKKSSACESSCKSTCI